MANVVKGLARSIAIAHLECSFLFNTECELSSFKDEFIKITENTLKMLREGALCCLGCFIFYFSLLLGIILQRQRSSQPFPLHFCPKSRLGGVSFPMVTTGRLDTLRVLWARTERWLTNKPETRDGFIPVSRMDLILSKIAFLPTAKV